MVTSKLFNSVCVGGAARETTGPKGLVLWLQDAALKGRSSTVGRGLVTRPEDGVRKRLSGKGGNEWSEGKSAFILASDGLGGRAGLHPARLVVLVEEPAFIPRVWWSWWKSRPSGRRSTEIERGALAPVALASRPKPPRPPHRCPQNPRDTGPWNPPFRRARELAVMRNDDRIGARPL